MYELLDPETKVQLFLSVEVVLCVSLELCPLDIIALQYYTGVDASTDCGSWIRWLVRD